MEPTIVSTSTGAIAIAFDYSPYLERIATSLETIVGSLNRIPAVFTTGSGILTTGINTTTLRLTTGTVSVLIDDPHIPNGVKPTFTVGTTLEGTVTNITVITPGIGYIHPPIVSIIDSIGIVATGIGVLTTDISVLTKLKDLSISANSSTQSLKTITEAATTTGLRSYNAYDWIKPLEMISWYTQGYGVTQYSSAETDRLLSVINSLTNRISKFE
jgi:hypothetical protein